MERAVDLKRGMGHHLSHNRRQPLRPPSKGVKLCHTLSSLSSTSTTITCSPKATVVVNPEFTLVICQSLQQSLTFADLQQQLRQAL